MIAMQRFAVILSTVVALVSTRVCRAADDTATLAPFVNDDTFLAAQIDLAALAKDNAGIGSKLLTFLPSVSDDAEELAAAVKSVEQVLHVLRDAGVDNMYVVAGLGDMHQHGGPLVVLHVSDRGRTENVAQALTPLLSQTKLMANDVEVRAHSSGAVLAGTRATVDRYTSLAGSSRDDLTAPLTQLATDGAVVAAVFCPGPDFRRVVRELWPELPEPLAPLRGELADRWLHVEAAVNLPPDARPRLALQATDPQAAETFVNLLSSLPAASDQFTELGPRREELKLYLQMILAAMPPRIDGTRVNIGFPTKEEEIAASRDIVSRAADAILESGRRQQRMKQFKQLAIVMHNYHDVYKHFPPAAICDAAGRPLLSWRVAILPYLEEGALYKQFHLDEPWDSPHNRTLIAKMPTIYADPDPKLRKLAREGKTTYQVPVGPETVFHNTTGTTFREIVDGTSQTIFIVEVEPLRAAVWTKPEDWEIDLAHPRRGVVRTDRNGFVAARCDGSAHFVPNDISEETLRALLTRAGRDVVNRP